MNKTWWTIDRVAMLIGLMVTLMGWGISVGTLLTKVNALEAENAKLEMKVEKQDEKINTHEKNIVLNADAVDDITDLIEYIIRDSRED